MTERTPQGWIALKRPRPKGPDDSQEDFFPDTLPAKPDVEPEKDLFQAADEAEEERDRALVDQLIADTHLYDSAQAIKELLEFTVRLRHIAPFNAMLLHIQKPGLSFAARPKDWWKRFRRKPKPYARPLVVLRNFGPVEFVYDVLDTEGEPLPEAAFSFPTQGEVSRGWLAKVEQKLNRAEIQNGKIRLEAKKTVDVSHLNP